LAHGGRARWGVRHALERLARTVAVARDLGKVIEITSGLAAANRVIETPPDGIAEGDSARIVSTMSGAVGAARNGRKR
jgi:hypothetical protein